MIRMTPFYFSFALLLLSVFVTKECFAFVKLQRTSQSICHGGSTATISSTRIPILQLNKREPTRCTSIPTRTTTKTTTTTTTLAASLVDEPTLWAIRAISALGSYGGLIAYFDRPRGPLEVSEESQVEIKTSTVPNAGLGLFARTNLPKGTVLGCYPGVVIPLSQNLSKLQKYPACEGYIWRFSDNAFVIDPTNKYGQVDTVCTGGRDGLPGSQWLFENVLGVSVPTTLCRINEPPLGKDVNVVTDEDLQKRSVLFSLERDVAAGEEFFIDYGLSYDRSMYGKAEEN